MRGPAPAMREAGAARRERGRVQGGNRRVQVHVALLGVQRPAKGRGDHAVFPHVLQRLHRDAAGKQGPEVPGVRADVQRVGRQVHFFLVKKTSATARAV